MESTGNYFPHDKPLQFVKETLSDSNLNVAWNHATTRGVFRKGIESAIAHASPEETYKIYRLLLNHPVTKQWVTEKINAESDFDF